MCHYNLSFTHEMLAKLFYKTRTGKEEEETFTITVLYNLVPRVLRRAGRREPWERGCVLRYNT